MEGRGGAESGFPGEAGLGFEAGALPLSHVAEVGGALGLAVASAESVALGLVGHRIDPHLGQPLLEMGVPVVLDLIVSSLG